MIVRECEDDFTMITQHDHADLSAQFARQFKPEFYMDTEFTDDVLLAIREHDRGWIGLDEIPLWNDRIHAPFSFFDYPLYPKLLMYTKGINEVERTSRYAALLCSLHYTSFANIRDSKHPDCVEFMNTELRRQEQIGQQLIHPASEIVLRHLWLLQLCDDLSLRLL
nr:DUF3891 family protein [Cohnella terricola]